MGCFRATRVVPAVVLALAGAVAASGCRSEERLGHSLGSLWAEGEDASRWPALPGSSAGLDELIGRFWRGAPIGAPPRAMRQSDDLAALVRAGMRSPTAVAGWPRIEGWLGKHLEAASTAGRRLYLFWGVHHDSPGQLAAFHRLALASPRLRFDLVVVEQLDADGHWADLPKTLQRGDDQSIQRFLRQGRRQAWQRLRSKQQRDNFTARRYGYVDQVLGLLAAARQRKQRLVGCDMNVALQAHARQRLRGTSSARHGDPLLRMRELHCWLALQRLLQRASPVRHVAMLWGQSHIDPSAFPDLVPKGDAAIAVYVLGQRIGPHGIEKALPKHLQPAQPLLLPIDDAGRQAVLLLPGRSQS